MPSNLSIKCTLKSNLLWIIAVLKLATWIKCTAGCINESRCTNGFGPSLPVATFSTLFDKTFHWHKSSWRQTRWTANMWPELVNWTDSFMWLDPAGYHKAPFSGPPVRPTSVQVQPIVLHQLSWSMPWMEPCSKVFGFVMSFHSPHVHTYERIYSCIRWGRLVRFVTSAYSSNSLY